MSSQSVPLGLHLTTTVAAREDPLEYAGLLLANETLAAMGFQTNTRAWVGTVRCYWVTLKDEIPSAVLTRAFINGAHSSSLSGFLRPHEQAAAHS